MGWSGLELRQNFERIYANLPRSTPEQQQKLVSYLAALTSMMEDAGDGELVAAYRAAGLSAHPEAGVIIDSLKPQPLPKAYLAGPGRVDVDTFKTGYEPELPEPDWDDDDYVACPECSMETLDSPEGCEYCGAELVFDREAAVDPVFTDENELDRALEDPADGSPGGGVGTLFTELYGPAIESDDALVPSRSTEDVKHNDRTRETTAAVDDAPPGYGLPYASPGQRKPHPRSPEADELDYPLYGDDVYMRELRNRDKPSVEERDIELASVEVVPGQGYENIRAVLSLATDAERDYWARWYDRGAADVEELAAVYSLPKDRVAGATAVLSPQLRWEENIDATEKIIVGRRAPAYGQNQTKAKRIIEEGALELVSGPKVEVFYESLMAPEETRKEIVLDGHAINIWRGVKVRLQNQPPLTDDEREQVIRDYAQAGLDEGLEPQEIQAITWAMWRAAGAPAPEKPAPQTRLHVGRRTAEHVDAESFWREYITRVEEHAAGADEDDDPDDLDMEAGGMGVSLKDLTNGRVDAPLAQSTPWDQSYGQTCDADNYEGGGSMIHMGAAAYQPQEGDVIRGDGGKRVYRLGTPSYGGLGTRWRLEKPDGDYTQTFEDDLIRDVAKGHWVVERDGQPLSVEPAGPIKWSCGHRREEDDDSCPICDAFGRPRVTAQKAVSVREFEDDELWDLLILEGPPDDCEEDDVRAWTGDPAYDAAVRPVGVQLRDEVDIALNDFFYLWLHGPQKPPLDQLPVWDQAVTDAVIDWFETGSGIWYTWLSLEGHGTGIWDKLADELHPNPDRDTIADVLHQYITAQPNVQYAHQALLGVLQNQMFDACPEDADDFDEDLSDEPEATLPAKWSCGHTREEGQDSCKICDLFGRPRVTAQRQPWVCVDMDGTILEKPEGARTQQDYMTNFGDPIDGAADALRELASLGWRISIYTARFQDLDEAETAQLEGAIAAHLRSWQIPFTDVWTGRKPQCDYFVDDKAIQFDEDWSAVLTQLAVEPMPKKPDKTDNDGSAAGSMDSLVDPLADEAHGRTVDFAPSPGRPRVEDVFG